MARLSETERTVVGATGPEQQWTEAERHWARRRLEKKRKLRGDLVAYVVINLFLVGAWAVTGFGYFWPGWILAPWGVLLVLDAWAINYRRPITEDDIDRELRKL
jgi:hypothetical protein